jgi:fermentation-respiration switch protein FrsA (DUF1100 family)
LLILVIFLVFKKGDRNIYSFEGNKFYFSQNRGEPEYEILDKSLNNSLDIYKIKYKSLPFAGQETYVYGLLFVPQNKKNAPGIVYLPGGGGTKEGLSELVSKIAELGYAALVIDQRGLGETGGVYLSFQDDYQAFLKGNKPMHHLAVFDALIAFDVIRKFDFVDKNKVVFMGESMGARYAIIAASMEKRAKGVIGISTSGFHININPLQQGNDYFVSIDPDNYISSISPNYVMMLHGTNDTVVPIKDAQITFSKAKEPKRFFIAENCNHGYCEKMDEEIKKDLEKVFMEQS